MQSDIGFSSRQSHSNISLVLCCILSIVCSVVYTLYDIGISCTITEAVSRLHYNLYERFTKSAHFSWTVQCKIVDWWAYTWEIWATYLCVLAGASSETIIQISPVFYYPN